MTDFVIKDSGKREAFGGGMIRDVTEGKIDFSLALDGPMFKRLAEHLTKGAIKYTTKVDLTFSNWYDIIGKCQCNQKVLVPTDLNTAVISVEAVMKRSYDSVIQSLQNGNEKTPGNGQTVIVPGSVLSESLTKLQEDIEPSSSNDGDLHPKMNPKDVTFVDVPQGTEPYPWIITTRQDFLEAFSVNSATLLSVASKTVQNYLTGHSNICPVRLWRVEGTSISKPGKRNWMLAEGEVEYERFKESALRHFLQWYNGDTDEDHAAATYFNINGAEYVKGKMK